jgi:putative tricarboxylic transport membrane protein
VQELSVSPANGRLPHGFLALALLSGACTPAGDAPGTFPSKPIVLITHSSPGAGGDVFVRQLGKHMEPIVKVAVAVENVTGGSSARAVSQVAGATPDGYTLYGATPTMIQIPLLTQTANTYKDLQPVANVFFDPLVIYTRSQNPVQTLADVLDDARQHPEKQRWGASVPGSVEHMVIHQVQKTTGIKVVPVTFEGGGDLLVAVLGGHVDYAIGEPAELVGQLQAGQIRLLASFTEQPLPGLDAPAAREAGVDVVVTKFRGLLGPKGMPKETLDILARAVEETLAAPAYRDYYTSVHLTPAFMGPEAFGRYLDEMNTQLGAYLEEIGVRR